MLIKKQQTGFTIVELLIVVVVIAILAAITIVSYNGIKGRAQAAQLQSDLSQTAKKLETVKTTSGGEAYPDSLVSAGLASGTTDKLSYSVTPQGKAYCLNAQDGSIVYNISSISGTPRLGSCGTVQGLIGWWPMNGDVQDKSGNNLQSTAVNVTPAAGVKNEPNTAYSFNGTNSQILCGTSSVLQLTSAVTVTAWVRPSAFPTSSAGILNYGSGGYWLTIQSNGRVGSYITNGLYSGGIATQLNQWQLIVMRYSPSDQTISMSYGGEMNGAFRSTGFAPSISGYGSEVCQIGSIKSTPGNYFNGLIDDVRIYNRALTSDEIDNAFTAGAY